MSDYKQRVHEEKNELNKRIMKLEQFLRSEKPQGYDWRQHDVMVIQLQAMKTYQECLERRIEIFSPKASG